MSRASSRKDKPASAGRALQLRLFDDTIAPLSTDLHDAEQTFSAFLMAKIDRPAEITFTNNRCSIITVRPGPDGSVRVRIHRMFVHADDRTKRYLAGFINHPSRKSHAAINEFIRGHREQIERSGDRERREKLQPRGKHFHLQEILLRVSRQYNVPLSGVKITWGKPVSKDRQRSIKFGCYYNDRRLIRVHPALDAAAVPLFFVEYIVYHELLHAVLPARPGPSGRRQVHTREFKDLEQKFSHYRQALAWEKEFVKNKFRC